ncbi:MULTISPECIES: quinol dehydrogenase ferredoxin subunit NapH [Methylotenera]|uniref:quinol dehydrogenase ferredoxin subunit NapH n=1 Tax=Methylotenera TaxID=359407 RepID=UPI000376A88A|nr:MULTISPECIES: quinol dehydrogenase ferredoxin subunit NapH [Methylotenera]
MVIANLFRRIVSFLKSHRWLLMRRTLQILIVLAFVVDIPEVGHIAHGNLSSSFWFWNVPLSDPFVLLQSLLAGAPLAQTALIGAAIVAGFYAFFGGRIYCSWVCPINILTDAAHWLRQKLKIKGNLTMSQDLRSVLLVMALVLSVITGTLAWENINPITLLQREIMWSSAAGLTFLAALFLFDFLVTRRGWCGHLCPVGAFYRWIGHYGRLRVTALNTDSCSGCTDCIKVCPEPHVLAPLFAQKAITVTNSDCTRCGACLDKCGSGALSMKLDMGRGSSFRGIPIVKN